MEELEKSKLKKIELTKTQKSILLGSLLGDGSLKRQKNYKNVRFQMRHSIKQDEYFNWKANELSSIATENAVHVQKPDGYSTNKKLHFQTRALPALTNLHYQCYVDNKLAINESWLQELGAIGLLVWWLDDGSKIGAEKQKGRLCTYGFSEADHVVLQKYLKKYWNIETNIVCIIAPETSKQLDYFALEFNSTEFQKFLKIIMPHLKTKSMLYKFVIPFKNQNILKDWIQEMKNLMPHFEKEINEIEKKINEKR